MCFSWSRNSEEILYQNWRVEEAHELQRKLSKFWWNQVYFGKGMSTFWGGPLRGTTRPPNPPSCAPTQTKRVPICSFLNSASICILNQIWNWIFAKLRGKKLRYGCPCTHDLPGNHNWLAQPHIASISSELHWLFHAGTILEVWSKLLLHLLDSPCRLHPARVPLTCGHVHRPTFLPILLKKCVNQLGLSWGYSGLVINCRGGGGVVPRWGFRFWGGAVFFRATSTKF